MRKVVVWILICILLSAGNLFVYAEDTGWNDELLSSEENTSYRKGTGRHPYKEEDLNIVWLDKKYQACYSRDAYDGNWHMMGFQNGLVKVASEDRFHYLDQYGQEVFSFHKEEYMEWNSSTKFFCEDMLIVPQKVGDDEYKYGFINKQGEQVIPCIYDHVSDFSGGVASVRLNDKSFFIDKSGQKLWNQEFDEANSFSEGVAAVIKGGKWGYINDSGETVIPFRFDKAESFHEGLAAVTLEGVSGFIDKSGNINTLNVLIDSSFCFSDGIALVNIPNQGLCYIDRNGKIIRNHLSGTPYPFSDGRGLIEEGLLRKIYINRKGEAVIDRDFLWAEPFSEGLAYVWIVGQDNYEGYIDINGVYVTAPGVLDEGSNFVDGLALIRRGDQLGILKNPLKYPKEPISIVIKTPEGDVTVNWGPQLFEGDSREYNNDLAMLAAALSTAAEDRSGNTIVKAYQDLGFFDMSLYSYPDHRLNRSQLEWAKDDVLAFSIAHRKLGKDVLLVVTLAGTKEFFSGDTIKDLSSGLISGGTDFFELKSHDGFYDFYEDVRGGLLDYATAHPELGEDEAGGKLNMLVTGHSLGGAGANLVGAWLNSDLVHWSDFKDTFVYTFAAPNTVYYPKEWELIGSSESMERLFGGDNIFNIVNIKDAIPKEPAVSRKSILPIPWRKYGNKIQFDFLDQDQIPFEIGSLGKHLDAHHVMKHYIRAIEKNGGGDFSNFEFGHLYRDPSYNMAMISVRCPVDVEIRDRNHEVVGRIVNNWVDESVTQIPAMVYEDEKYFWVENPQNYEVRVIGNDSGKMNLTIINENGRGAVTARSEFQDVEIVKDKVMESTLSTSAASSSNPIKLYTLDKNDVPVREIQSDGKEVENLFDSKVIQDVKYSWTVRFNKDIDPASVTRDNFFIQDAEGNILDGIEPVLMDGSPSKVQLKNHRVFEKNKDYYLVVRKAVVAGQGQKMKQSIRMKFRVE